MTMLRKVTCVLTVMGGMLAAASSAFAQQASPLFAVLNGGNVCNGIAARLPQPTSSIGAMKSSCSTARR
jgi:hypothetical protein